MKKKLANRTVPNSTGRDMAGDIKTIRPQENPRPTGISMLGWFYLAVGMVAGVSNGVEFLPDSKTRTLGIIVVALAGLIIFFALGLLKGKKWSWYVAIVVFVSQTLGAFNKSLLAGIFTFLVSGGILAYCFTPSVRAYFGFKSK